MYRPITLANSDYKIILRVWSTRLGPILNDIVGEHQKGFIPTRDGRENIIVVQAIIDKLSKLLEGGVIFLDLKKAFDRVSHEALLYMLQRFRFPDPFINTVKAVYSCSRVQLVVNQKRGQEIPVESGTKQGCPLSPLARGIGFDCTQEVKYLGCQVGINPDYHKMWKKVLKNMVTA